MDAQQSDIFETMDFTKLKTRKYGFSKTEYPFIYNLFTQRRASKAFYRSPEATFLPYFHVVAGNHQQAYHYSTISPNKDIVDLGFEFNFH